MGAIASDRGVLPVVALTVDASALAVLQALDVALLAGRDLPIPAGAELLPAHPRLAALQPCCLADRQRSIPHTGVDALLLKGVAVGGAAQAPHLRRRGPLAAPAP